MTCARFKTTYDAAQLRAGPLSFYSASAARPSRSPRGMPHTMKGKSAPNPLHTFFKMRRASLPRAEHDGPGPGPNYPPTVVTEKT